MIPFKVGMVTTNNSDAGKWELAESLYNEHFLNGVASETIRIPKIIHQIWLGSSLPPRCVELQKTWKDHHRDWAYRLWTDANTQQLKLQNRAVFEAAKNLGAKSDILRYELLYQFGGLYVDTDFECLKSFDHLHYFCDFYAGVYDASIFNLQNALIACAPGEPILKDCLDNLRHDPDHQGALQIFNETGPQYFTRWALPRLEQREIRRIIFPSVFFYPMPGQYRFDPIEKQREYFHPEAYAIHYWHVSWKPQKWWRKRLGKIKRSLIKVFKG